MPTESIWPHTAESKITPGLNRYNVAAASPSVSGRMSNLVRETSSDPHLRPMMKSIHATPMSAAMPGILTRPAVASWPTTGASAAPIPPSSHSTYR